eukprot:scaffold9242_cov46-Prasinocladus_malaysianus.AAC.1
MSHKLKSSCHICQRKDSIYQAHHFRRPVAVRSSRPPQGFVFRPMSACGFQLGRLGLVFVLVPAVLSEADPVALALLRNFKTTVDQYRLSTPCMTAAEFLCL